ncbi:short chain dehydrogenase/reductase [Venturia nashicola]|nr:short chain dehydrogenase/reductase [Venturia nashicola]
MAYEKSTAQLQKVHVTQTTKSPKERSWQSFLTIDVLYSAALKTILHPFVAFMIPVSLRAVTVPYSNISMQVSIAYATLLAFWWMLSVINKRVAFGLPREVDLDEEVIVITGGSNGLGRLIADFYAMRGASVAVLDVAKRDDDDMMGLEFYRCDVGDRTQVEAAAAKLRKDLGVPTILINNAAVVNGKSILDLSTEEVEKNFRVNLLSHYHTVQTFLPGMLDAERGTIVTIASVLGYLGCANLSDYTAAKAGLVAFHASLKAELSCSAHQGAEKIKTVLVTPGQLGTPMFGGLKTPSTFLAPIVEPVELAKEIACTAVGSIAERDLDDRKGL